MFDLDDATEKPHRWHGEASESVTVNVDATADLGEGIEIDHGNDDVQDGIEHEKTPLTTRWNDLGN